MNVDVIIIGAGIAGLETASTLFNLGLNVVLIEKQSSVGGHVANWFKLFPNNKEAKSLLNEILAKLNPQINILLSKNIVNIQNIDNLFIVSLSDGLVIKSKAIVIATGYDLFDARLKEEYGYGIFNNVITSADLEKMLKENKPIQTKQGKTPFHIGFVHCVGSRDKKVNNIYCSKVCCITAVKQAIELKKILPLSNVYCFYIDLRMFGLNFEEIYNESQEKYGVTFIRGKVSEVFEDEDNRIIIKAEDTLLGRPLKMTLDLLVLMIGMVPSKGTKFLINTFNLPVNEANFVAIKDEHIYSNETIKEGVFVVGAASSPKTINETLQDARAASLAIFKYIQQKK